MDFKGEVVFTIYDENLDFERISNELKISPSKIVRRGTVITSKRVAPSDEWLLRKELDDINCVNESIVNLLDCLLPSIELIKRYNSNLSVYIRSDNGQIGIELDERTIEKIAKFNIGLDFHILSFGLATVQ